MTKNGIPSREAIHFRPCTPDDAPFLTYLYASTRVEELSVLAWSNEQKAQFLANQFQAQKIHYDTYYPDADFLVIESEGKPLGRLYIDRTDDMIEIVDIALLPEYRAHGLGRVLLQEILDEGQATGKKVMIYVEHNNPARHLYDRLGFQHVDTNGVYHQMEWKPR